jgi:hypothetical protein
VGAKFEDPSNGINECVAGRIGRRKGLELVGKARKKNEWSRTTATLTMVVEEAVIGDPPINDQLIGRVGCCGAARRKASGRMEAYLVN